MPDGIDLILADHEQVNALFDEFDATGRATLVGQLIGLLELDDAAEHAALYPLAGTLLQNEDLIMRSAVAHSAVKKQIDLIGTLEGAPLVEAVGGLRSLIQAHVDDEEENLLPALRAAATSQQIEALGARIVQAKQRVG